MAADGLWSLQSPDQRPVPLAVAPNHLSRALASLDAPPAFAAEQPGGWRLLRVEVPVTAPAPQTALLLDWLEAQSGLLPRTLFATRDGSMILAGAGAAHIHSQGTTDGTAAHGCSGGTEEGEGGQCQQCEVASAEGRLLPEIGHLTHERLRYVGGVRFDASDPEAGSVGPEWEPFGRSYWVLPRMELSVGQTAPPKASAAGGSTAENTETVSSCPSSTPAVGMSGAGEGCLVSASLAVQLRWHAAKVGAWEAERRRALQALRALRPCGGGASLPGAVARRSDAVPQEAFEAGVRRALQAFQDGSLQKVVLARRVLLELAHRKEPAGLLRQVVGDAHKRHYLFLLEPVEGTAFISLTPERLCRVQGHDIWTEAVAGTWPINEFEKIGESALLASSAKHNSEHQLVVDYIRNLLGNVSQHIKVCDTHILKLKHLVHIKQSYHAIAKDVQPSPTAGDAALACPGGYPSDSVDATGTAGSCQPSASVPFGVSSFFCERMSPTPAVCGLPLDASRRFIRSTEPFDRGLYAAPCGIVNSRGSELIVALRSALLRDGQQLHVYAGAGIVPGSNPSEEFAEISLKMRQFTEGIPPALPGSETPAARLAWFAARPNLNSLWASLLVEELVRSGARRFVVCPGSRSTPLVVAVQGHPHAQHVVHRDERGAAYFALGWAKATGGPVAVIVTSGTAVPNLHPAAVEASQARVPLLLLTADRPPELRDTGSNQTIVQPGIFGPCTRWAKDFPCPSVEYPAHALLADVDLAVAHATGRLSQHPGPVHLNLCFRENLAPDAGPVRGAPERTSAWPAAYVETLEMQRWAEAAAPRCSYLPGVLGLGGGELLESLVRLGREPGSRVVVLVGTLGSAAEALLAEDVALRLRAALFADITSGLRQRPGTVHYADQLLNSPLLAGELLQLDALVQLGGPVCSARLSAFAKAAAPRLHLRVATAPVRQDPTHSVTQHLCCSLQALSEALAEAGLEPAEGPPALWARLSEAAGEELEARLAPGKGLTEPLVAWTVSRYLPPGSRLQISSSMPIRDLDFFAKPCSEASLAPVHPPAANRGASGIDGVIDTAAGFCLGAGAPSTLVIGDVASLHSLNALELLAGPQAPALTVVIVNNGGGGIFSFLPIARHQHVMSPFFKEPHDTDFSAACRAFGVPHTLCTTAEDFEVAYVQSQRAGAARACVIEVRVDLSHERNVELHRELGQAVAARVRTELLSLVRLGWLHTAGCSAGGVAAAAPIVLLHGWLGEKSDWAEVTRQLAGAGHGVLAVDLPGHGATEAGAGKGLDPWEASALFTLPMAAEALAELLDKLRVKAAVVAGYSLGGRVAMTLAAKYPDRVLRTLALSANPGLASASEREKRARDDLAQADRLAAAETAEDFEAFLQRWYAAPLWAGLAERRPEAYQAMLARRRRSSPRQACHALLGMSLARQPDLRPGLAEGAQGPAFWYAYGALDKKFAALGEELRPLLTPVPGPDGAPCKARVLSLADAGHALVEECPQEVANLCLRAAEGAVAPATAPSAEELQLLAAWSEQVELMLKAPLLLSRGDPMPRRSGVLIILQARAPGSASDTAAVAGLGEVCPLPQFHKETLAEAQAQLQAVLQAWTRSPPRLPQALARLGGGMQQWLAQHCPEGDRLLPSVRAGLEMAILHLLGRTSGAPHLGAAAAAALGFSCSSAIGVNALVAREEDLSESSGGATVVKVKVGKDPAEDARRTNRLAELLQFHKGPQARLRLDANQAWTVDEAVAFVSGLSDSAVAITEYLEEPVRWTQDAGSFLGAWEQLAERTQRRVRLAADESLTEGAVRPEDLEGCKAPIAALILKPALQGLEQTLELARWAQRHGARPVVSSAFESGVALCHFAVLAAAMAAPAWLPESGVSACHGLGTFTRLAEDVLHPPFEDLVRSQRGGSWRVCLLECQGALDRSVDFLVAARAAGRC